MFTFAQSLASFVDGSISSVMADSIFYPCAPEWIIDLDRCYYPLFKYKTADSCPFCNTKLVMSMFLDERHNISLHFMKMLRKLIVMIIMMQDKLVALARKNKCRVIIIDSSVSNTGFLSKV